MNKTTYLQRSLLKIVDNLIRKYDGELILTREKSYQFMDRKCYRIDYDRYTEIYFDDMDIEELAYELNELIETIRSSDFLGIDNILMGGMIDDN